MTAMRAIAALLLLLSPAAADRRPPPATADYVIVGGGTAGCVVAARLCAALPHATVALLERGAPRNATGDALVQGLRLVGEAWKNPDLAEVIMSLPGAGVANRTLPIITGATLGGSSSINAGQWTAPGIEEVSGWGFPGFTGAAAEVYYRRVAAKVGAAVPPPDLQQRYLATWLQGAATAGIPTDVDPLLLSAEKPTFAAYTPVAADEKGMRRDSCTAYLEPVMHGKCRHNLQLVQGAVVSRIEVEEGRATGVTYLKKDEPEGRQERRVRARRQVVSSAGPYGSPKLLQLSGIGPAPLLRRLGVPLVQDLPVGQATQGRVVTPLVDFYTAVPLAPEANTSVIFSNAIAATFAAGGGGPLGVSIAGLVGTLQEDKCLLGGTVAIGSEFLDLPALLIYGVPDAQSRGTLEITAETVRDPTAPAAVNLNLLMAPGEAADVAQCMNRLQGVNDAIRQDLGLINILPGNPVVNETYVRQQSDNSYHFSAGCAAGSVVDGEFRVFGVKNLRVVDVSVIPKLPNGSGLMASVYALAEHASELIIAEEAGCVGDLGCRARRPQRPVRERTGRMRRGRGPATASV